MYFIPIDKMQERVGVAREDSDTSLFLNLLYLGEMLTKIVTAGLIAAIDDDRHRQRYRFAYGLVRADGLGDWSVAIDDILIGPAAQLLQPAAQDEQKELTQRCGPSTWQFEAITLLHRCLKLIEPTYDDLPARIEGRRWFAIFATLRNKTRGHGAPPSDVCRSICPDLEKSIQMVIDNFNLFKRPWAYLYQNLSGKYRVTKLTTDVTPFDSLKSARPAMSLPDGVYVYFDRLVRVDLIQSTVEAIDFFFPNGSFRDKCFELLSYITGDKAEGDSGNYMTPATELPGSETQGIGALDLQGMCFGNLPPAQDGYISRLVLESELYSALMNERHPIVTLVGRGGIGKTWLALSVLHKVAQQERFAAILWFSARDIDLLSEGPKIVTPHVLTQNDIAKELVRLMDPAEALDKVFKPIDYLAHSLSKSPVGPLLFVFDNFETVRSPIELFTWLDTYIRLPNKILITTRFREFKADYPIEVMGMTEQESDELISSTADVLGIRSLLTDSYRHELYQESDGHPYVLKILLGEVAKAGRLVTVERIVASKDEILFALFERTYSRLPPVSKRVFLTLCNWRSTVPQLAVEAVLLRPSNEKMDVSGAIDQLSRSSFIEITASERDNESFITVPLVAAIFGKRKLAASPMKTAVEADTQILHAFGAAQSGDTRLGVAPRIAKLFRHVAERVGQHREELDEYLPMLEFIARKYPPAWLLLASLHEELGTTEPSAENVKRAIRRFLESSPNDADKQKAWNRLAEVCRQTSDWSGEAHALVEMCELSDVPFSTISLTANRLNSLFYFQHLVLDTDEKQIVVQRLVTAMELRISEADATDCSRLAWLCKGLHDDDRAKQYTQLGLSLEPYNEYCQKLASTLGMQ
jgi:hypothetical protein